MTQPTTPNTDDIFRRIVEHSGTIDTSALSHGELVSNWRNEHITIATAAKICSEIVAETNEILKVANPQGLTATELAQAVAEGQERTSMRRIYGDTLKADEYQIILFKQGEEIARSHITDINIQMVAQLNPQKPGEEEV